MRSNIVLGLLLSILLLLCPGLVPAQFVPNGTVQSITPSSYRSGASATAAKVKVKNTAGTSDRFILTVKSAPGGWTVTPAVSGQVRIGPGNTANFDVSVTPPTTASEGGSIRFGLESFVDDNDFQQFEIGEFDISVLALPKPGAFTLLTPARNGTNVTQPVVFTWNQSSGSETYTLKLYNDNGVGRVDPPFYTETGITATAFLYGNNPALLAGHGYWWSVTAVNRVATTDNGEGPITFVMRAETPPSPFQFTSPANIDAVMTGDHPTFSWTSSAGALSYRFDLYSEVSGQPSASPIFTQSNLSTTTFQYSGSLTGGYYYALVTAIKEGTSTQVDGGKRRFNVTNLGAFTLVTPWADFPRTPYLPTFSWTASTGALAYQLEVYEQLEGAKLILKKVMTTVGTSYPYPGTPSLLPGKTYAWRVLAQTIGESRVCEGGLRVFTTTLVTAPILKAPANEEKGVATVPLFEWDTLTPSQVGTDGQWEIELAGSTPSGTPDLSLPFPYYSPILFGLSCRSPFAELTRGREYFYRVIMLDASNNEAPSEWRRFTVTNLQPFDLYGPDNGETNVATTPTLTWEPVSNATSFNIYVSIVGFGAQPTRTTTTNGNYVFTTDDHLNGEQLYSWAVEAVGPGGKQLCRSAFTFTTLPRETVSSLDIIDHIVGQQKLGPSERNAAGATGDQNVDVATYILFKRFE